MSYGNARQSWSPRPPGRCARWGAGWVIVHLYALSLKAFCYVFLVFLDSSPFLSLFSTLNCVSTPQFCTSSSFSSPSFSVAWSQHPVLSLLSCTVGHLGDAEMIKEHVDEAVTLIGALNGPGVSKLTMTSAYHKLASSFLSSVSSISFSPSPSVSPRYSVSAALLLTSSSSPSPSVFHCFSVSASLMLSPSVSEFHILCFVWCRVTCHILLILKTHIWPTRQYEIQICA